MARAWSASFLTRTILRNLYCVLQPGVYPLYAATHVGRLDIVQLLLRHGGDVDSRNLEGHAAFRMACTTGHLDILQELLEAGADPDMTDVNGRKPFHFVARQGSVQVSFFLRSITFGIRSRWGRVGGRAGAGRGVLIVVHGQDNGLSHVCNAGAEHGVLHLSRLTMV